MAFNTRAGGLRHPRDWPFIGAEVAFFMRGFQDRIKIRFESGSLDKNGRTKWIRLTT